MLLVLLGFLPPTGRKRAVLGHAQWKRTSGYCPHLRLGHARARWSPLSAWPQWYPPGQTNLRGQLSCCPWWKMGHGMTCHVLLHDLSESIYLKIQWHPSHPTIGTPSGLRVNRVEDSEFDEMHLTACFDMLGYFPNICDTAIRLIFFWSG